VAYSSVNYKDALAGTGKGVFVVHRRISHLHQHFAWAQRIGVHRFNAAAVTVGIVVDTKGLEGSHGGAFGSGIVNRES